MRRLTGCCCCFDLRSGTRAIGITLLVLSSLALVSQIMHVLIHTDQAEFEVNDELRSLYATCSFTYANLRIVFNILHLVFQALLVRGVKRKSPGLVQAWLIYYGTGNGIASIYVAVAFIFVCSVGEPALIFLVLALAVMVGVFWYWFVVVLHYFREMQEGDGFVYSQQQIEGEKHAV